MRHALPPLLACAALALAGPAKAQPACLGPAKLAIQAAQTRPGSGGSWNYVVRIANASTQAIRFDLRFVLPNTQQNHELYAPQSINGRSVREIVLASGTAVLDSGRITENIRLTCR